MSKKTKNLAHYLIINLTKKINEIDNFVEINSQKDLNDYNRLLNSIYEILEKLIQETEKIK